MDVQFLGYGVFIAVIIGLIMGFPSWQIRLVEASHYDMSNFDFLKGFISGLYAGNYDITHVFIDSLTKIVSSDTSDHAVEEFLDWLNSFSEKNNIKFTVTISADASLATEGVKKYF